MKTFQQLLRSLSEFWEQQGCLMHQGYDLEMGAGTFNPATFLRCLGPEPYRAAYIEPSRRPTDGRYGKNPNRLQHYFQYQVILKPSPPDIQTLYLASLEAIGLDLSKHDIRFVHDDWESPTLGAWGLGWEAWIDGMEVSQITYFQSVGGIEVKPVTGEITYGLERLAMFLQQTDSCYAIQWNEEYTYGDLYHRNEFEWSAYHFEWANPEMWFSHFDDFEREAASLLEKRLPLPAYDFVIKASHAFNILDARGVISVTERTGYIGRIRNLARRTAACYIESREELGHPLLRKQLSSRMSEPPELQVKEEPPLKQADFLLEIGSEELPAQFVPIGLNSLEKLLRELLEQHRIAHGEMRPFGTPRRLALLVKDLSSETSEKRRERRGPSLQKAFDSEGALTLIGKAFLKSVGLESATLQEVEEGSIPSLAARGEHLFFIEVKPPEKSADILSKELPKLILSLEFPKKMRWADYEISYARPILWIAALIGPAIIPFSLENLSSGRTSYGHRQLSPDAFLLEEASDYPEALKKRSVLACREERRASIEEQLQSLEERLGAQALEKERVLSEVLDLVENPFLTYAEFDPGYLQAPKELLVSEMVEHQRYFPLADEEGSLMHLFIIPANNRPSDAIKRGNEHVLAARLADGLFLYEQDLKSSLNELNEKLKSITFQKELGSVWDKVERLSKHVKVLLPYFKEADQEKALAASLYCKADLASHVVGEFPELQGVMGRVYAEKAGHSREAALAIEEHWLPKREEGPLPRTFEGALLSLADKLDNLLAFFGIGLPPSSSKDPHGLRRQVLGLIRLLIRQKRKLPLRPLLEACYDHFPEALLEKKEAVVPKILEFITNRIKTVFLDDHFPKDAIEASLPFAVQDIYDTYLRVEALQNFRQEQRGFEELYEVYKRTQGQIQSFPSLPFNPAFLVEEAEKELHLLLDSIEEPFREALKEKNYRAAYHLLREIQPSLARLFEEVKILEEDETVRNNRIALLQRVFFFFERLLDFSKIKLP